MGQLVRERDGKYARLRGELCAVHSRRESHHESSMVRVMGECSLNKCTSMPLFRVNYLRWCLICIHPLFLKCRFRICMAHVCTLIHTYHQIHNSCIRMVCIKYTHTIKYTIHALAKYAFKYTLGMVCIQIHTYHQIHNHALAWYAFKYTPSPCTVPCLFRFISQLSVRAAFLLSTVLCPCCAVGHAMKYTIHAFTCDS